MNGYLCKHRFKFVCILYNRVSLTFISWLYWYLRLCRHSIDSRSTLQSIAIVRSTITNINSNRELYLGTVKWMMDETIYNTQTLIADGNIGSAIAAAYAFTGRLARCLRGSFLSVRHLASRIHRSASELYLFKYNQ
jgi:hypothetical protein